MVVPFGLLALGVLLAYSGLKGKTVLETLKGLPGSVPSVWGTTQIYNASAPTATASDSGGGKGPVGTQGPVGPVGSVKSSLTPGRIDQGQDFSGIGKPIPSPWNGRVKSASHPHGWPGSGGLVVKFDQPIQGARYGFIYEDINVGVHVGQHVKMGQVVGHIANGSSGIEIGFCDANGVPLAHSVYHEGMQTQWGHKIAGYLKKIGFT